MAQERKQLATTAPKLPRGRPRAHKAARRATRRKKAVQRKVGDLFENRYLFVRKHLERHGAGDVAADHPRGAATPPLA